MCLLSICSQRWDWKRLWWDNYCAPWPWRCIEIPSIGTYRFKSLIFDIYYYYFHFADRWALPERLEQIWSFGFGRCQFSTRVWRGGAGIGAFEGAEAAACIWFVWEAAWSAYVVFRELWSDVRLQIIYNILELRVKPPKQIVVIIILQK